jgi:hypothetical protein
MDQRKIWWVVLIERIKRRDHLESGREASVVNDDNLKRKRGRWNGFEEKKGSKNFFENDTVIVCQNHDRKRDWGGLSGVMRNCSFQWGEVIRR